MSSITVTSKHWSVFVPAAKVYVSGDTILSISTPLVAVDHEAYSTVTSVGIVGDSSVICKHIVATFGCIGSSLMLA